MIEKTINKIEIYKGKIISLFKHTVKIGDKISTREIVEHPGAVCAVAINKHKKIILVKQFRKATEDYLLEIPAGKIEPNEDKENSIIREIKEETGYDVSKIEYITEFFTSPGFANEKIHLYFVKLGEKGNTNFDEGENIDILEYDLEDIIDMIKKQKIIDSKTITGILLYNYLKEEKK